MVENTKQRPQRNEREMSGDAQEGAKKDIRPQEAGSKRLEDSEEESE